MRRGDCTVEVTVAGTFSWMESGNEGDGVGEGGGVEGGGVDGATTAVMTGAAIVDECSPGLAVLPTSILVDTAAVVVMNHTVTSGLLVCSSTPLSSLFRSSRT